ncbi:ATP-grasp domain-containing protein [Tumebacillus sp. DT12]|uniref:ATP-grasp domain-containing protein n=1 Tax=Tumebacillus lacus TaxID=2995335 RepID=A0ABT3X0Z7_9BACL|nr:ATP-grasp domain-containing protein [Tumebacillus lacus]MCX7569286.1 ATP-grasp domain-containing protein [Tumebacillus lacus]
MRTIVFLGVNKSGSSREAVRAAANLGYLTVLLTDRDAFLQQRSLFPDVHRMIRVDLTDEEAIRQQLVMLQRQGRVIELIVSMIEPHVTTAARLSREICGTPLSCEAMERMQDKILTRDQLRGTAYGVQFASWDPEAESWESWTERERMPLPAVVKSPRSTGSKDVLKAVDEEELRAAAERLAAKYDGEPVLIEEYLDGPQVLVEALVWEGTARIVAVIEQEISKEERFIVTGYAVHTVIPDEWRESLPRAVQEIVTAMGMDLGACHLEMRDVRGGWKLIESNPRISGGAMNSLIEAAYGINLMYETLRLFLGETPNLSRRHVRPAFAQYVTVKERGVLQRVTGKQQAASYPSVHEVYVKPKQGTRLQPPLSMGHRYAYVIATGNTLDEARELAKHAAGKITFHLRSEERR